jgi:hypothetical protein
MALPPIHFLVGAACGEVGRRPDSPAWKAWVVGGVLAVLPDVPSAVALLLGYSAPTHGLYSHTLLATTLAFAAGAALGGLRWGAIAGCAYGSHLVLDLLRDSGKTSVYLFGPFIDEAAAPIARLIPHIPFDVGFRGSVFSLHGLTRSRS